MCDITPLPRQMLRLLILSMMMCLACGAARAVPVTGYITVQPIDVCSGAPGTTTGCAPINSAGQNYLSAPVGVIGSNVSGTNVTRAIWTQIGLDITYMPAVQYPNAGGFLTLAVDPGSNPLTSTLFKTLSDQDAISQGQPPTPAPPLSQNPTTINMFFLNRLVPITPPGGTLYGFSWIDNNGVAIAANSLSGLGARPDTIAHELGHNFDLDHNTFGAGPDASGACNAACAANLMTAGDSRTLSTNANVLTNLATGKADQLNTLQSMHVLDPTGFLNPIPGVSATVSPSATASSLGAASTSEGHHDDRSGIFHVSFDTPGRPGEFLSKLTLRAPDGVSFLPNTFRVTDATSGLQGKVTCESPCSGPSIVLDFTSRAFVIGQSFDYKIGVCRQEGDGERGGCRRGAPDQLLENGTYTYQFETDGLADGMVVPFEIFQTTSDLLDLGDIGFLSANSQEPDLTIPSQILNPLTFVGFFSQPCTLTPGNCPPLVLADADPAEDNPAVPEPPSILIFLLALAVLAAIYRLPLRGRLSLETGPAEAI
jgi:hypothetical protein